MVRWYLPVLAAAALVGCSQGGSGSQEAQTPAASPPAVSAPAQQPPPQAAQAQAKTVVFHVGMS